MENLFTPSEIKKALNRSKDNDFERLKVIRDYISDNDFNLHTLSKEEAVELHQICSSSELKKHCSQVTYFIYQVEHILLVDELTYETECDLKENPDSTESKDELFDFWQNTDLAYEMFELLNYGDDVLDASKTLSTKLFAATIAFYKKWFLNESDDKYMPVKEMGDNLAYSAVIPTDDFNLNFYAPELTIAPDKVQEIQDALKIIKEFSPISYDSFATLTTAIVGIDELGVVSYSSQFLPGYSSINIYDRDFVDLIDDLIHENGHHHLNAYLNHQELINEDDEEIFYSPWRRAMRPIRGLYHACFTFYMALQLFGDLLRHVEKLPLTDLEKAKVKERFLEEYVMLTFCRPGLDKAYNLNKINPEGYKLINHIYDCIKNYDDLYEKHKGSVDSVNELNQHLRDFSNQYKL